ncbi:uncharacterized protein FRV6_14216 [Fusarium oxysporum]|uniref:Uncharacterized protein n=1 Tax=Fusarium oxysporum TaxID=5507 RepID=A0A2H3TN70_FUSOX|nr:uncharacterized protein FRV6_14216 [Fusarium oxysporum]
MQITKLSLFAATIASSVNAAKRNINACTLVASGLIDIISDILTANKTLESFLTKQTNIPNIAKSCTILAVTGSIATAYTSYAKSMLSSYAIPVSGFCSTFVWATATGTKAATATAKATNSITETATGLVSETAVSTATPSSVAENSGAYNTGFGVVAVAAMAGLAVAGAY